MSKVPWQGLMMQDDWCVCVGNVPEDRFVAYFVESLKEEDESQFDTTLSQFMECAKACRKTKQEQRVAAQEEARAQAQVGEKHQVACW